MNTFAASISETIWDMKYRLKKADGTPIDNTVQDTWRRIAFALSQSENEPKHWEEVFYAALEDFKFLPAGRIIAGAGTDRRVTLSNCYTMGTIPDSIDGIFDSLKEAALTMQQGGGIGYDFSTIRPKGALVKSVASDASGPLSFMDVWDAMCRTIMSAGSRRGAMMATMRCDHPDIEDFIAAKADAARLRMFNLSVLVTDDFMEAVKAGKEWRLHFENQSGETLMAKMVYAPDLWNKIMQSTYDYAEPGVIFIDRINEAHNIGYLETIATTNPCVPGDTPILTKSGYVNIDRLIGQKVEVWNGFEFTSVTPFKTGENQPLVHVRMSDGTELTCTPTHEFVLSTGDCLQAQDLSAGDKLEKHDFPVIEGELSGVEDDVLGIDPYIQGFFSGDGTQDARGRQYIALFGEKKKLRHKFSKAVSIREYAIQQGFEGTDTSQTKLYVYLGKRVLHDKGFVPTCSWGAHHKVRWLAGLMDADGCAVSDVNSKSVQISAKDREFLLDVKFMLNTIGVRACLGEMKDMWRLCISAIEVKHLQELGLQTYRLDLSNNNPARDASRFIKIISVEPADERSDTFCFTETKRGTGIFNGVRTGQCGEKPMGPYASCLLGSINLTKFVVDPFTEIARMNINKLKETVHTAIRMMDNVIDVGGFPLPDQKKKAEDDRQLGLGVTGLADALAMCGVRYGDQKAIDMVDDWMSRISMEAYRASSRLAEEKGSFPTYDKDGYFKIGTFASGLPEGLKRDIGAKGIRNSLLLSIAPTGTISLYAGNVSSGIEPIFAHSYTRKVLQPDGSHVEELVEDYAVKLWRERFGDEPLPDFFATAQDLSPLDHVKMQAAAQKWVDSSISKTINCPEDISFPAFKDVYMEAWDTGCKGCTTYRPNDVTGSVISVEKPEEPSPIVADDDLIKRPQSLDGTTYKIKLNDDAAVYVTITDIMEDGTLRPFEVFLNTKNPEHMAWMTALTRMISAVFRRPHDSKFVAEELKAVFDPKGGGYWNGRYWHSMVAAIGQVIEDHMRSIGYIDDGDTVVKERGVIIAKAKPIDPSCPKCHSSSLRHEGGCEVCTSCGHSKCG